MQHVIGQRVGGGPVPVHRRAIRGDVTQKTEDHSPAAARRKPCAAAFPHLIHRGVVLVCKGLAHFQRKGTALDAQHAVNQPAIIRFLLQHGTEGLRRGRKTHQGFVKNVARLENPDGVGQPQAVEHCINCAKCVQLALIKRFQHEYPHRLLCPQQHPGSSLPPRQHFCFCKGLSLQAAASRV